MKKRRNPTPIAYPTHITQKTSQSRQASEEVSRVSEGQPIKAIGLSKTNLIESIFIAAPSHKGRAA